MKKQSSSLEIQSFIGGFDSNLSYLITDLSNQIHWVIDPAVPLKFMRNFIKYECSHIFITHSHFDHIIYLNEYCTAFPNSTIICHPSASINSEQCRINNVDDGDQVISGSIKIEVLYTPGHSPDSLCFKMRNEIFTGDTIFVGRTGRVISVGSNIHQLFDSVYNKILNLPASFVIYPGHDYGLQSKIALSDNIAISPLLRAKNESDFIKKMMEYESNR